MNRRIKKMVLLGGIIFLLAGLVRVIAGDVGGIPLLALAGLCLASWFILAIKEGKPGRTSSPVSSEKMVKGILKKCEEGKKLKKEADKEKKTGKKTIEWILHKQHCKPCMNGDKKTT